MKVFRFMSKKEFDKYKKGEVLKNNTKHTAHTTSEGFCFMDCEDYEPEYAYNFLSGVVSYEVCAIFETNENLIKSEGLYADPYGSFFDSFLATEYCTKTYNKKDFKLIKYCYDFDSKHWKDEEWNWEILKEENNE